MHFATVDDIGPEDGNSGISKYNRGCISHEFKGNGLLYPLIAKTPEEAFETSLPFGKARLDFTVSPNAALRTALARGGESQQPGAEALDAREEKVRIAADAREQDMRTAYDARLGKLKNLTLDLVRQLRQKPASGASAASAPSGASSATVTK